MKKDEFDQAFERYLKERFKPFRDKERPADYGRDLAPNRRRRTSPRPLSIAPVAVGRPDRGRSPINRKDGELDIVLISAQGRVGRAQPDRGLRQGSRLRPTSRRCASTGFAMPWMSWSPKGDRLAYFVRTEKERTLIVQNVLTRKIEVRVPMKSVDEPESPSFSPDGRTHRVLGAARRDRATSTPVDLDDAGSRQPHDRRFLRLRADLLARRHATSSTTRASAATRSCSGSTSTRRRRRRSPSAPHDEAARSSSTTTRWCSRRRPSTRRCRSSRRWPRNGNIYNVWTLDLNTGELRQFTDALGGNTSPVVLREGNDPARSRSSATTRAITASALLERNGADSLRRAVGLRRARPDHRLPGAAHPYARSAANQRRKGAFEKMFLEGRPPVNLGVTNNGDVFGGTEISFGDVLGDKQINMFAASISQYRTLSVAVRQPRTRACSTR